MEMPIADFCPAGQHEAIGISVSSDECSERDERKTKQLPPHRKQNRIVDRKHRTIGANQGRRVSLTHTAG